LIEENERRLSKPSMPKDFTYLEVPSIPEEEGVE
jgi:hypothetical protein